MTLSIHIKNPAVDPDAIGGHYIEPAGFETYRKSLWGTIAIRKRSPILYELGKWDAHISPAQFDEFLMQCDSIRREVKAVVRELVPLRKKKKHRRLALALLKDIPRYMQNFEEGVQFAREHGSNEIWIG